MIAAREKFIQAIGGAALDALEQNRDFVVIHIPDEPNGSVFTDLGSAHVRVVGETIRLSIVDAATKDYMAIHLDPRQVKDLVCYLARGALDVESREER